MRASPADKLATLARPGRRIMSASRGTIDVSDAIERAPFGRFQLLITGLCA